MKKVGLYIFFIIFLLFLIPIIILGGIGGGIDLPKGILPGVVDNQNKENLKIKVFRVDLNKVEEMNFEEYVVGVLAAEIPAAADINALQAQAIAARTYALAKMKEYGGNPCPKHPNAGEHDVCSDVHCQAWISKEERFKRWETNVSVEYWDKLTKAVNETKGKVLSYEGQLASAIKYHASSGGKTENSLEVFGYVSPYLVSVDSEYEKDNPQYQSKVEMSKDDFIKKMKAANSKVDLSAKSLATQIKVPELTESGRVKKIQIGGQTFTGDGIRWAMGLKSSWFTVQVTSSNVVFNVRGSGHGVGLSQRGAMEMAANGKKYDEILKHYYQGVEINNISDIFKNKNQ